MGRRRRRPILRTCVGRAGADTHPLLEQLDLLVRQGIRLGDNRHQVHTQVQALHKLDVQRLEAVSSGGDEVQARVDAVVDHLFAVDALLLFEERVVAGFDGLEDGLPGVLVVDVVAESGSVDDGQAELDAVLLDVCYRARCKIK